LQPVSDTTASELEVLRDRCRHYERALRTIIANPTKAAEYAQSALDMGTA